jgi:lipopolysaccharide heptosyltransferase II
MSADEQRLQRWRSVRRVLAVRLDNLGDVLMTTPALAAIRQSVPGVHISLLTSPAALSAARCVREVDDVIAFDAPWSKASDTAHDADAPNAAEQRLLEQLSRENFDAAVIFTVCTQSALPAALWCRMAGIPLRLAHSRENPYNLLSDWVPDGERVHTGMRHEVMRQLALVAHVGWGVADDHLRLALTAPQRERMRRRLHAAGVPAQRSYFVVHPGASAASRRYPAARFGIAADAIAARGHCLPIFTGDAAERALIAEARCAMTQPSITLAGQLDVAELAALIDEARLLLANNSGPAHIAAAVGTPLVVLYALTNPQHTPWRAHARVLNHDVPCRHCLKSICPHGHHDCLARVEPGEVAEAALELLGHVDSTAHSPTIRKVAAQHAIHATQGFIA